MRVHPKDKPSHDKKSNVVYGITCKEIDCDDTYIGETKQPLSKRMYQHRRPSSSGVNDSAVYSHLKFADHKFDNKDVLILDKEHNWFERGVKEAIYVRLEEPTLNRGGGLRHNLSHAYDGAIDKVPRRLTGNTLTNSASGNTASSNTASGNTVTELVIRPDEASKIGGDT